MALVATGAIASDLLAWAADPDLASASVHSLPLWGMAHKHSQPRQAAGLHRLITVEDHLIDGGFGSWMTEALQSMGMRMPLRSTLGLDASVCGVVGAQATLNAAGGLTLDRLKIEACNVRN
jgi:transketolase